MFKISSQLEVLKVLKSNPTKKWTTKELSKQLNIHRNSSSVLLRKLIRFKFVEVCKVKNKYYYRVKNV